MDLRIAAPRATVSIGYSSPPPVVYAGSNLTREAREAWED